MYLQMSSRLIVESQLCFNYMYANIQLKNSHANELHFNWCSTRVQTAFNLHSTHVQLLNLS